MGDPIDLAYRVVTMYFPFMIALCFHEYAHGWMAMKRGDNTAKQMGRLTMNPMAHADPIGTVALPIMAILFASPIFFGWAKPVPFDPRNLKNPRVDSFWIALAGPLSNVLLAFVGTFLYLGVPRLLPMGSPWVVTSNKVFGFFIMMNLFLAVFNMIPLHPLDGGKVLARFLSYEANRTLEDFERYTGIILLVLILSGALKFLLPIVDFMANFMFTIVTLLGF